ncbi:MAG TPA: tripartite tricarboxylate transporter substrate binding protein [Roseomonas sp.]|jgi:tripartite-type tricarboxylate transporter receptor subunit TctC
MTSRIRRSLLALVAAGSLGGAAQAQPPAQAAWPSRPIRIVAPFPPGGLADVLARTVGDELGRSLGQPVVVDNRAGAGGNVGAEVVARAAPDGYTLMMSSTGILSINQFLYPTLGFDPEKGFEPISVIADMPMLLVVNPRVEARTAREFVALAQANPGKLNFGSAGNGTTGHLALALFTAMADVRLQHVPYRGAAPAVQDVLSGQLDGVFDNPPTVISHIRAGALRPLLATSSQRMPLLPEVPTAAEVGLPQYSPSSWFGLAAPAGTPEPALARLQAEVARAVRQPAMQRMEEQGMRMVGNTREEFARLIVAERERWGDAIRRANIRLE